MAAAIGCPSLNVKLVFINFSMMYGMMRVKAIIIIGFTNTS